MNLRLTMFGIGLLAAWADVGNAQPTRLSVHTDDSEAERGGSGRASVSNDGRYVAFWSYADNLIDEDFNHNDDVFLRDRWLGRTTRISVASNGAEAHGDSFSPRISGNGRYVVFLSYWDGFTPAINNAHADVFVHDRVLATTVRASVSSSGDPANADSLRPDISADGRFVVFQSDADNLVANDTNQATDIFVRDMLLGETTRVSVSSSGSQSAGVGRGSSRAAISGNGRYVAFDSLADNFVPIDTNNNLDVFVHDRQTGSTVRASVSDAGAEADGRSAMPAISDDGRYVAFLSKADQLVPGDENSSWDVFVRDLQSGSTHAATFGSGLEVDDSYEVSMSPDGRFLAFQAYLAPGPLGLYLHDRRARVSSNICVTYTGSLPNNDCNSPEVAWNGSPVVFTSQASNLVPGDDNQYADVFSTIPDYLFRGGFQ